MERNEHMCCQGQIGEYGLSKFIRNFKILFINDDELLFKNANLIYLLDDANDLRNK